jgi:hypothetical protein
MSIRLNKDNIDLTDLKAPNLINNPDDEEENSSVVQYESKQNSDTPNEERNIEEEIDDPIEKRKRIKEIMTYKMSRLGKYLDMYDLRYEILETKSIRELDGLLKEIKYTVGVKTNLNFVQSGVMSGINSFEFLATKFTPLKIQGLSYHLDKNEEFKDLVCEVSLKYQNYSYIEPEARLGLLILQTAIGLHHMNSTNEETQKVLNTPMSPDIEAKYSDI